MSSGKTRKEDESMSVGAASGLISNDFQVQVSSSILPIG
jgi:hypothetical protein